MAGAMPGTGADERLRLLGAALAVRQETGTQRIDIQSFHAWTWPPIVLGQIAVALDVRGNPAGYLTWAFLSDATAAAFAEGRTALALPDWNAGANLWIIDLAARRGVAASLIDSALVLDPPHTEVHWLSRRGGRPRRGPPTVLRLRFAIGGGR